MNRELRDWTEPDLSANAISPGSYWGLMKDMDISGSGSFQSKSIVHAGTDDVFVKPRTGDKSDRRIRTGHGKKLGAKIDIKILGSHRPIGEHRVFDTVASGPAQSCA